MRALVSTASYLLLIDLETRSVTVLENNRTEYYGISWFPGVPGLVLGHSGDDNASLTSIETYYVSEKGWVSHAGRRSPTFLSQPHQILCGSDGRVICTNTGRNRITVIDLDRPGHYQEAGLSDGRWDRFAGESRGDHLNSVFEQGGKLYAIAHGLTYGSRVATFSYPDLTPLSVEPVTGRIGMHNIFVDRGQQIACASELGSLVDIGRNTILWESGAAVYSRGLAATNEYLLVGDSPLSGRDFRHASMSGLWVVNRKTWATDDYLPLGPFGAVHEVRIIDEPDLAHHGAIFASGDLVGESNLFDRLRESRLALGAERAAAASYWRDFTSILSHTEASDGWLRAAEMPSITVRRAEAPEGPWKVDYRLEPGGHVSAIFDYGGMGDSEMRAYLLQSAGHDATLALYVNDGMNWEVEQQIGARLPVSGRLEIQRAGTDLTLSIDGRRVHKGRLPETATGRLSGLRWCKASLRPVVQT